MNKLPLHVEDLSSMRKIALRTLVLLLFVTVLNASHSGYSSNQVPLPSTSISIIKESKKVLVLFSYHRAEWSDNVQKGIESVFTSSQNVHFFYEYMDTKRLNTREYLENLRKIYIEKYARANIDLIVCVDNNSLDLLVKNANSLLPDIPVVFCGINDYKPSLHSARPGVTGVVEHGDFSDTLKIAFKARPNATKIFIICDKTETGKINKEDLIATLPTIAPGVQAILTDSMKFKELSTTLKDADPQQVAFFVSYWKDSTGMNIEPWQLEDVFRKSSIPVFGRSEWMINHGMVGGKCVTGFAQGEAAAKLALLILSGKPVSTLPVDTNSPNQYLFDYRMLQNYLINENILPDNSIVFNRPESFFRVPKTIGTVVFVFSLFLLTALIFLVVNIQQRRKAEEALRESEFRYRGMIENIQDTFYRTDAQGVLIFISPSGARLLGYNSPQEMIGKPISFFWKFPELRLKMLEIIERDGAVHDHEVLLICADGSPLPVSTTSGFYYDKDSQILGVEGIFRDITERKQAEKALKQAFDEIRTLRGIVPICASCKKIRDDKGFWSQVEVYVQKHTEAEFSHGICPDCMKNLYPEIDFSSLLNQEKGE
jgi:PAS domain S-box-containing protein